MWSVAASGKKIDAGERITQPLRILHPARNAPSAFEGGGASSTFPFFLQGSESGAFDTDMQTKAISSGSKQLSSFPQKCIHLVTNLVCDQNSLPYTVHRCCCILDLNTKHPSKHGKCDIFSAPMNRDRTARGKWTHGRFTLWICFMGTIDASEQQFHAYACDR